MQKENNVLRITKVNRYYDTEHDIEYFDIEFNGDKPDPEEDTVKIEHKEITDATPKPKSSC